MRWLFRDKIIGKLIKVPTFIWFLLLCAAEFFGAAYANLYNAQIVTKEYVNALADNGVTVNKVVFEIVFCVFSGLVAGAICELIIRIAYAVIRRFALSVNKADFCFRVRLVIILSDLILGLVGIVYFFYPVVQGIVSSVLEIAVPALLLGWFYEDLRERFVPAQNQAKVFGFVSRFYLGIYLALGVLNLIYEMGLYFAELTVLEIVELALDPAVVLILGVVAYLNYRRLKNISEHSLGGIDNNEQQKPKDETIFKDFGF